MFAHRLILGVGTLDRTFSFKDLVYACAACFLIAVGIGWVIALTPAYVEDSATYYVAPANGGDR